MIKIQAPDENPRTYKQEPVNCLAAPQRCKTAINQHYSFELAQFDIHSTKEQNLHQNITKNHWHLY